MKYRIYSTSQKAWAGMLSAIRGAKQSIYLEMYILIDDGDGSVFFEALETAAQNGVRVVVLLDVVGSYDILSGAIGRLRTAGAEVLFSSFLWQRLHRKVLVIDQGTAHASAFIGGVNVGRPYRRWKDLQIEVRGTVVDAVARSFVRVYRRCGGRAELFNSVVHGSVETKAKKGVIKKAEMWFVDHGIGKRRHQFRKYYEERFHKAQISIVMVTPYLFPPRWLIARLHQAILRGVRVEVLLPRSTDHRFINSVNRSFAAVLTELGAQCYFMDGMNHAKAMLVDQENENAEAIIGSQNLDLFSFNLNIEAGVFTSDKTIVAELKKIIEGWKLEAIPAYRKKAHLKWYDLPMAFFLRIAGLVPLE